MTPEEKQNILLKALGSEGGRVKLAQAMINGVKVKAPTLFEVEADFKMYKMVIDWACDVFKLVCVVEILEVAESLALILPKMSVKSAVVFVKWLCLLDSLDDLESVIEVNGDSVKCFGNMFVVLKNADDLKTEEGSLEDRVKMLDDALRLETLLNHLEF